MSALPVVLIGINPKGRGGELARALATCQDVLELVGVVDDQRDLLDSWPAPDLEGPPAWRDLPRAQRLSDLLGRAAPRAALLAIPHSAYAGVRRECLAAGLGMFHEKPLACTLAEVLELQSALTTAPVPLVVGVQRRSHPAYVLLREELSAIRPETLVVRLSLDHSEAEPGWRGDALKSGGGALIDLGYHAVDLVHFLLAAPLEPSACSLWRRGAPVRRDELETAATIVGRAGETWVRVEVDRCGSKCERVEVACGDDRWTARRDGLEKNGLLLVECPAPWDEATRQRVRALAEACAVPAEVPSLWDHLAILQVIEHAYHLAPELGLGRRGAAHG